LRQYRKVGWEVKAMKRRFTLVMGLAALVLAVVLTGGAYCWYADGNA
jgi:hypothetical protein